MNILITGGTGFVGSHMIDYILDNETDVKIYATKRWMEDTKNVQKVFDHRAKMNGASTEAKWNEKLEQSFAA